jgi:magnesium transporter
MELKYRHADEFPHNLIQLSQGKNMWVEISSTNVDLIRDVLIYFDAHTFVIDDIRTLEQRMKISVLQEDIYLLLNLIYLNEPNHLVEQQIISFYLRKNTLITIQEYRTHTLFSTIKHRLAKKPIQSKGRLKKMKIDYLFYCLLTVVIENYMAVLDTILYETERIDKELMFPTKTKADTLSVETLKLMFHIKHDLLHFKIVCAPLKDIIIKLQKTRETVVPKRQRPALRQCRRRLKRRLRLALSHNCAYPASPTSSVGDEDDEYISDDGVLVLNDYIYKYFKRLLDHAVQLNDTIDSYSDIITSLIDFYIILNGDLSNKTMQTLTIMSCIFMPLNFFSSLSSMNFKYMPQIPLPYGYFGQLGIMGLIGFIMIVSFKLKKLF